VIFEPRRDGVVQVFEVLDAGPEAGSKGVTVRARVRTPAGQVVERTLVVTMQRGAGPRPDRWFITGFRGS
jgi:hypothetical protein